MVTKVSYKLTDAFEGKPSPLSSTHPSQSYGFSYWRKQTGVDLQNEVFILPSCPCQEKLSVIEKAIRDSWLDMIPG